METRNEFHENEHVVVTAVKGKLTIGAGDVQLRDAIMEVRDWNVVLDFAEMTTIDSSGMAQLVGSSATLANVKHGLRLLNVPEKLLALLHVTQLITVFGEVYTDKKKAIEDPFTEGDGV